MRRNIMLTWCLVCCFCILGCPSSPTRQHLPSGETGSDIQVANSPEPSSTFETLSILAGGKELPLAGNAYEFDDATPVEFQVPKGCHVYIVERKDDEQITAREDSKWVSLQQFNQDVDWFVFTSPQPLSEVTKQECAAMIATVTPLRTASPSLIQPAIWRIYTVEGKEDTGKLQWNPARLKGYIEIAHAPFSLQLLFQKEGGQIFQKVSGPLHENSPIQVRVMARRKAHLGLFLCYFNTEESKHPDRIVQIFPSEGTPATQEIQANTALYVPSQGGIPLENASGRRILYCFPTDGPQNCSTLQQKLTTLSRGIEGVVEFNEGAEIPLNREKNVGQGEVEAIPYMRITLPKITR